MIIEINPWNALVSHFIILIFGIWIGKVIFTDKLFSNKSTKEVKHD